MRKSFLLLHIAVIFAGFTGVFGKLISLNEGLLSWYRTLFSAVILWAAVKLLRIVDRTTLKEKFRIALPGMLITVHWVFFYASIKYSNISIGVVCYCLTSFFTAIFKPLIGRTAIRYSELALSALTMLGIGLIFHFDVSYRLGILLGVVSSAFAALYTIFNERLVREYDSRLIIYYQMLAGAIGLGMLLPPYLYLLRIDRFIPGPSDTVYLLLLSLFCTVGLYVAIAKVFVNYHLNTASDSQ